MIAIRHLIAPFGAHVGFSRQRCQWQLCGGATIPPRQESRTKSSVSTSLAAIGPKADFAACHYPVRANPHPQRWPGSDRRQARSSRPRALVGATPRSAHRAVRSLRKRSAFLAIEHSLPTIGGWRGGRDSAQVLSGPREVDHMGGAGAVALATLVRAVGVVEPGVFGRLGGTQNPLRSGMQSTRFEPYRVRAAPRERPPFESSIQHK